MYRGRENHLDATGRLLQPKTEKTNEDTVPGAVWSLVRTTRGLYVGTGRR